MLSFSQNLDPRQELTLEDPKLLFGFHRPEEESRTVSWSPVTQGRENGGNQQGCPNRISCMEGGAVGKAVGVQLSEGNTSVTWTCTRITWGPA